MNKQIKITLSASACGLLDVVGGPLGRQGSCPRPMKAAERPLWGCLWMQWRALTFRGVAFLQLCQSVLDCFI